MEKPSSAPEPVPKPETWHAFFENKKNRIIASVVAIVTVAGLATEWVFLYSHWKKNEEKKLEKTKAKELEKKTQKEVSGIIKEAEDTAVNNASEKKDAIAQQGANGARGESNAASETEKCQDSFGLPEKKENGAILLKKTKSICSWPPEMYVPESFCGSRERRQHLDPI